MTREEIINGLKMSMDLTLFDPSTGEVMEPRQLNDINRTAYEAYKGAIELLEKQPDTTTHDSIPAKTGKNDGDRTSGDCISRRQAINEIHEDAEWLAAQGSDWQTERMERDKSILMSLPSAQPEQQWHPITEKPPYGKDLMLKLHDSRHGCDCFYYFVMGFYDGDNYQTYLFRYQDDKSLDDKGLEVVGWQLCPWEGEW